MLAGVEVGLEFIVKSVDEIIDPGYCLELYAPEDRSLEWFGESLFDFLGTSKLDRRSAQSTHCQYLERHLTSDSRASKKFRPEWPVI